MPKILIPCREQICYLYFEVLAHYQTSFVMLVRFLVSHSQLFVILADTPGYSRFLSAPILEFLYPARHYYIISCSQCCINTASFLLRSRFAASFHVRFEVAAIST